MDKQKRSSKEARKEFRERFAPESWLRYGDSDLVYHIQKVDAKKIWCMADKYRVVNDEAILIERGTSMGYSVESWLYSFENDHLEIFIDPPWTIKPIESYSEKNIPKIELGRGNTTSKPGTPSTSPAPKRAKKKPKKEINKPRKRGKRELKKSQQRLF